MNLHPLQPPSVIECVDCGEDAHLLNPPRPDIPLLPGEVLTYRCTTCLERFDIVWEEPIGENDGRTGI
jgi:DNA-directed RNA polymerase subunit RPC12/RpoP